MAFLNGRVSYERFAVTSGTAPLSFEDRHLEILESFAIGRFANSPSEGVSVGFSGGDHILDLEFKAEKNFLHGCLVFSMRVDTNKVPADLLRAYTQMELQVISADNPSGYPSRKQRQQAKELAKERCRAEAQSGRFRKMREFPVLWDAQGGFVYFGSSSVSAHDLFRPLFRQAFGLNLSQVTSGSLAVEIAEKIGKVGVLDDVAPYGFVGPKKKLEYGWLPDHSGARDFLGNEFLLWLWWILETHSDTLNLSDKTTVSCLMSHTLTLECPLGETGKDTIASQSPPRLPESKKALSLGKMPRKTGLILVRHDEQYELKLQAETLGVGAALLPKIEAESSQARLEDRVVQIRHLSETLDLLYEEFCRQRLSSNWSGHAAEIRGWLQERSVGAASFEVGDPEPEAPALRRVAEVESEAEVGELETAVAVETHVEPVGLRKAGAQDEPEPELEPESEADVDLSPASSVPPDAYVDSSGDSGS